MLELVIDNHLDYFKEYSVFQLFNDNNIATLIGIYCMVKNIKTRDESLVEDDSTSVDSLREYFNDIDSVPPITPLEMQELGKKVKQGDEEARNRLTEGNLKLVVSIAKVFYRLNDTIPIQDLINAGNIGLMKAASKFDIDLGFRFSTYATYWIRTEIVREIQNNERSIRIPISMREKINAYNHLKEQLMQQKGTEIGYQEMAEVMRVSMNKAIQYERVQEPIVSLNAYYGDDEDTEMQELICIDDFTADIDARNSVIDTKKLFKESGLTDKEIYVLSLRYGYYDGSPRTLEEIGNIYGVTRERIRQIEAKALYKLRICESTKKLAEYTSNPDEALEILQKFSVVYSESELNQKKTNPLASQIINYNTVKKKVK